MKNYWLDKKNELTNDKLTEAVVAWNKTHRIDDLVILARMLDILGTNILKLVKFDCFPEKETIKELTSHTLCRTERFDPEKGKAFNFFTTIMISLLRQLYRSKKDSYEKSLARRKKV